MRELNETDFGCFFPRKTQFWESRRLSEKMLGFNTENAWGKREVFIDQ